MKHNTMLTIASLLSVLLVTFHLADDIIRGMEKGGVSTLVAVPILVVWLYGTLVLAERRSGYIIMLLLSLFSLVVPYVHMKGKGVGVTSRLGHTSGHFFFVWTLFAIGVTGLVQSALAGIYAAALYRYATTGEGTLGFDAKVMQVAFAPK